MVAGFSCLNFVVTFFLTWFPGYLVTERGFDLLKLGLFGVIPGLTAIAGSWAGGMAGDALLARGWSLTRTRTTCWSVACSPVRSSPSPSSPSRPGWHWCW